MVPVIKIVCKSGFTILNVVVVVVVVVNLLRSTFISWDLFSLLLFFEMGN